MEKGLGRAIEYKWYKRSTNDVPVSACPSKSNLKLNKVFTINYSVDIPSVNKLLMMSFLKRTGHTIL